VKPLAFYTTLPPSASGIGQYSAELLPALLPHYAITAVLADDAPPPDAPPAGLAIARDGHFAAAGPRLYQLGNSPEHAYILARAGREPGILVLHDVVLQHLHVWRALHGGAAGAGCYRAEMTRRYGVAGAAAADDLLHNRPPAHPYARMPLSEGVVERSLATIVHSRYARDTVLRQSPTADVTIVPHGVPLLPPIDRAMARAALGLPQGALIVAALGNLIPEKRLEVALSAFARALYGVDEALFVVAGTGSRHYDPRIFARRHGLEPVTRWLGRADLHGGHGRRRSLRQSPLADRRGDLRQLPTDAGGGARDAGQRCGCLRRDTGRRLCHNPARRGRRGGDRRGDRAGRARAGVGGSDRRAGAGVCRAQT